MESSRHVNCNRIIYRKGAVHRTEKDRVLILTYVMYIFYRHIMLLLVTCMSALLQARFPMSTDMHLKRFCMHKILCTKNFHRRVSLNLVLLLLLVNVMSEFRLELMYISLIVNIRSSLTHLHGFQLLVWLP